MFKVKLNKIFIYITINIYFDSIKRSIILLLVVDFHSISICKIISIKKNANPFFEFIFIKSFIYKEVSAKKFSSIEF